MTEDSLPPFKRKMSFNSEVDESPKKFRIDISECESEPSVPAPRPRPNAASRPVTQRGVKGVVKVDRKIRSAHSTPVAPKRTAAALRNAKSSAAVRKVHLAESKRVPPAKVASQPRPAWDLRGRLADYDEKLKTNDNEIHLLKREVARLQGFEAAAVAASALQSELERAKELQRTSDQRIDFLQAHGSKVSAKLQEEQRLSLQQRKTICEWEARWRELECVRDELAAKVHQLEGRKRQLQADLESARHRDVDLVDQLNKSESVRRRLHEIVQDLKGNVRVVCRIRPLLPVEKQEGKALAKMTIPAANTIEIEPTKPTEKALSFEFNAVFDSTAGQDVVFDEISQLVQSVCDGFNVSIFAYGQTGSGKTHTMQGPEVPDVETEGMISRSISQIFASMHNLQMFGWKHEMTAMFLEIYNDNVRDLLADKKGEQVQLRMGAGDGCDLVVSNAKTFVIERASDIFSLLATANRNRAVAETKCNSRSSRSHSVFTLRLTSTNDRTDESHQGTLNLIDLAGSERLSSSESAGDRQKEAIHINTSLSMLARVIRALVEKGGHVPYRDCKLTQLLQPSLSGSSKTLMFLNTSPRADHVVETINSLRFGAQIAQCHLGVAKRNRAKYDK